MNPLLSVTFALVCLIFPAAAVKADFCVVPELPEAVSTAKLVFSGKIVDVSQAQANAGQLQASSSDYIVKFEVEQWWKGTGTHNIEVLWRTSLTGCSYFPVGNIGDRYLVYAEGATRIVAGTEGLLEISISNRTSKIPAIKAPLQFDLTDREKSKRFLNLPEVNRADASAEIEVLHQLRDCECLAGSGITCMGPPAALQREEPEDSKRSNCCDCIRRHLRPFSLRQ